MSFDGAVAVKNQNAGPQVDQFKFSVTQPEFSKVREKLCRLAADGLAFGLRAFAPGTDHHARARIRSEAVVVTVVEVPVEHVEGACAGAGFLVGVEAAAGAVVAHL